ncbi:hypothetical protein LOTGIDRAFT_172079 [Lottia gigantea]|uniref:Glycosyl transferase family 1 domain-containing protein n=1 Tax=Lottia gigantea TaxID=225164 RepID=V4B9Y8_LOTGI|nr:hypothetical protein LOTGIDRAFT_172079 [Lottia gigantea]ESP02422.1 hypothetical protein LOTGIDRAFT_172079 [Lottia gigantea]
MSYVSHRRFLMKEFPLHYFRLESDVWKNIFISQYLLKNGFHCHIKDPLSFLSATQLNNYLDNNNIQCLLGIHLYKSGCLLKDCKKPYVIIIGGTDVNKYHTDLHMLDIMTQTVSSARYLVVFGESLRKRVHHLWPNLPPKKLVEIKQAVITNPSSFCLYEYLRSNDYIDNRSNNCDIKLFLLISGIRHVKDPLYLVKQMSYWHNEDDNIYYIIIGPMIEEDCYKEFTSTIKSLQGVVYIPGLSLSDTHTAIKQAYCVVNSSKSEGMSLALLEAMELGTPVLARNICGNRDLITHKLTGLLFNTPQEFVKEAKYLIMVPNLRETLIAEAKVHVSKQHSSLVEEKKYCELISKCLCQHYSDLP